MTAGTADAWLERLTHVRAWPGEVIVLASCASTMDEALAAHQVSRPATCVVALEQTAGRGTHGRRWDHATDARGPLGVAMTLALDAGTYDANLVSIAAGIAVCTAANTLCGKKLFGVKWPNDVVLASDRRKLAGVLVEKKSATLLVGVGLNVLHSRGDFPPGEADQRVSLNLASAPVALRTLDAACALLESLACWLERATTRGDPAVLRSAWQELDALAGQHAIFVHDKREYAGVVEAIDPFEAICLRLNTGELVRLPAATTDIKRA